MLEVLQTVDPAIALQLTPGPGGPLDPVSTLDRVTQVVSGAVGTFVLTLVVGAILVAVAEEYTLARMTEVVEEPVGSFLYGVVCLVFLALAILVLVVTIIGIVVALPLILLTILIWSVGAAIAFIAIGDRLVGHEDGWAKPLLVGAALNGGLALTGVGGVVSFLVGAAGFGAVLKHYVD